ncbi:MAG TPA: hypothetical protein VD947_04250 [Patescibacteria group bacterium]|nr:hypothetical protein [Patescibacteria group bacterium]
MSEKAKAKKSSHEVGSAFDLLGKSYEIVKKNWQVFAVVNILSILGAFATALDMNKKSQQNWTTGSGWNVSSGTDLATVLGLGAIIVLALGIVGLFLYAMSISLQVKSSVGKKPDLAELFEDGKKYFFPLVGTALLSGLIVLGGLILLIVPGIIAIGRLAMAPYHVVDKNLGVIDALKASNNQAIGKMGLIYAAIGVTIVIALIAALLDIIPIIGPLVGVGVTIAYSLVLVLRYQQLKKA